MNGGFPAAGRSQYPEVLKIFERQTYFHVSVFNHSYREDPILEGIALRIVLRPLGLSQYDATFASPDDLALQCFGRVFIPVCRKG